MPMSDAYEKRVRKDNWGNFSVLRHRAFDGVLVTSKNSGTHWVKYMFSVALADTYGVPRPEYFSENAVRPYIGWPKDKPTFPELPRLAFSHTIPHKLADWTWARGIAGLPPYVLFVRHPMSILASHHAKWNHELEVDWLDYLRGDPSGSVYRCDLYWLARFWNRWGDILEKAGDRIYRVHYEDTRAKPRAILGGMAAHWQISLTSKALDGALKAGTKEAMAKKVDPEAEANVLQFRKTPLSEQFSGEALEIYRDRVKELFRHDLGYDLMNLPKT